MAAKTKTGKASHRKVRRHIFIPDTQVKPGVPISHIRAAGRYVADWQPGTVIIGGDWWDFPSLSSFDEGTSAMEGRRIQRDIDAGNEALDIFTEELLAPKGYTPRMILLEGNHDGFHNGGRPHRFLQSNPKLIDFVKPSALASHRLGWKTIPFLEPVTIDGVIYCHYFCRSASGGVVKSKNGAPSARAQVQREMRSCTAGHKQGLDTHIQPTQDGILRGVIAGSFYQHEEEYLTPQGRAYWRGILLKHDVNQGAYDLTEVSLDYLLTRYA